MILHNIKVGLDEELEEHLSWLAPGYSSYRIFKKSVDARTRHLPHLVYSVEIYMPNETPPEKKITLEKINYKGPKPIIIGAGPAGLFAALRFIEHGVPCVLFEQGSKCNERMKSINRFWRYGELSSLNNVCFGEGGAGLYSDGKLITRIKSPYIDYVMNRLVQFGAPEEIEYMSNPHVGSDKIRRVIPKMRDFILQNGGEIHFDTKITRLLTEHSNITLAQHSPSHLTQTQNVVGVETHRSEKFYSDKIILACGHSAEDTFSHLEKIGVFIEGKDFAVGLRIEHPQKQINTIQFREAAEHPRLGAANYRLAHHDKKSNVGVYSFCMCPGGYVLSSGTSLDGIVCNGMSNYSRGSPFANAAIVVTVDHKKSFGSDKWGGMKFRKYLETRAHEMVTRAHGTKEIPVQRLVDFISGRLGTALPSSTPSGVKAAPLHELLPKDMHTHFLRGIENFSKNMKGFISEDAQLHGIESRTSCPIRITRDADTLQSLSHIGLYPCGEGAGYAGGITSAACDGIKIVEKILS